MTVDAQQHIASDLPYDLTVITVCRNVLPELKHTLRSVLAQKAKGSLAIEHVIVDGASDDGTPGWLEESRSHGRIENYVSEPDSGIYDAMNKGIRMARGRVLVFMNAGDSFADADVSCCVRPIIEGRCRCVVGVARYLRQDGSFHSYRTVQAHRAYYDMIACHQACFFDAKATREWGGYDAATFRSAGDLELLNTFMRHDGLPLSVETVVADFVIGGFSADCWEKYRHEFVEIQWRSWAQLQARCAADSAFAEMMAAMLARHCLVLGTRRFSHPQPECYTSHLAEMIGSLPLPATLLWKRGVLFCIYALAFRCLNFSEGCRSFLLRLCDVLCAAKRGNPYVISSRIGRVRNSFFGACLKRLRLWIGAFASSPFR